MKKKENCKNSKRKTETVSRKKVDIQLFKKKL